ncbi:MULTISPECIES: polysaccharide biosynthesis/export family protein [unclassified Sulfitobacter]|uniref:polysaccharide biosynthesis/export family protein n=1 Tax=unclassified Sulfitobacter TaxID=196795 RepID=UPI0037471916
MFRYLAASTLILLSSCGVAYISPLVTNAGGDVHIVPLTFETVLAANKSPYEPKQLPAAFFQTVGHTGVLQGTGPLPSPVFQNQAKPGNLALRVPNTPLNTTYHIGVGDVLSLAARSGGSTAKDVSGLLAAENRRQGYTVQDDGAISIPDVGRVKVLDLTLEEAEAAC